jgi:hypothetical protein
MLRYYLLDFDALNAWAQEIDKKGKKKKGTLGIGNGALFFASDSDKTPVQQWKTTSITVIDSEKPKYVMLQIDGPTPTTLHFNAGSKDTAEAILAKLDASKSANAGSSTKSNSPPPSAPENGHLSVETKAPKLKQKKSVNFSEAPEVISPEPVDDDETYDEGSDEGDTTADTDVPTDNTRLAAARVDETNAAAARAESLAVAAARTRQHQQQQREKETESTETPRYSVYMLARFASWCSVICIRLFVFRTRPLSRPPSG